MARDLSYAKIPIASAKAIKFAEVLETSWETARWDNAGTECMVHWEGKTPRTIQDILKQTGGTTNSRAKMLTLIDSSAGKAVWGDQPVPPQKPKTKK